MLEAYARGSDALAPMGAKKGKLAVGVDKFDETQFVSDASSLPKKYFSTVEGVKQLKELTGDPRVVEEAAGEYAANLLSGKDAKGVRQWVARNREFLHSFPELRKRINSYTLSLEKGERISVSTKSGRNIVEQSIKSMRKKASDDADRFLSASRKEAEETIRAGDEVAAQILGDKTPASRVAQVITSGSVKQWNSIALAISKTPESKTHLMDAVKQVIADKIDPAMPGGHVGLTQFFKRDLVPFLKGIGVIDDEGVSVIVDRLAKVESMQIDERDMIGFKKRILLEMIGGYAASGVVRTTEQFDWRGSHVGGKFIPN